MTERSRLWKAAAMILLTCGMIVSGCGNNQSKSVEQPAVYGVADMDVLIKSHPKYTEYFKEKSQYERLLAQYKNEQMLWSRMEIHKYRVNAYLEEEEWRTAAQQECKQRIRQKENELNQKWRDMYVRMRKKYENIEPGKESIFAVNKEQIRLVNLQMKWFLFNESEGENGHIKKEVHDILDKDSGAETIEINHWTSEDKEILQNTKKSYEAELQQYAEKEKEEFQKQVEEKEKARMLKMPQEINQKAPDEVENYWKEKIEKHKKKMTAIYEEIIHDIREEADAIGKEKHLKMIFVKYRVNRDAVDVTGDIAGRIIKLKK